MVDSEGLPVADSVGAEEREGRGEAVEVPDCTAGERVAVNEAVKVPLDDTRGEEEGEEVE